MGTLPTAPWKASWDFYETRMDGKRCLIALDLGAASAAPVERLTHRLQVRVEMLHPREDGLRSSEEMDALFALEDRLSGRLAEELGAVQVGRVLHDGYSEFVYYLSGGSAERATADLPAIAGDTRPYVPQWLTEEDERWGAYFEFLWPDAYAHHTIMNRRLMTVREQQGDRPDLVREIDHLAYFADEESTRTAAEELRKAGYRVDAPDRREGGDEGAHRWFVEFHHDGRLDEGRPDAFTVEILGIVSPHGGEYDGWGATILKE